ncbi:MAG: arsenical pump-driving ATPase [Persicimonas sp.]
MINCLTHPTRFLFFTGKGGVGKTSTACATAIQLAEQGKKVLLVSTDPASNLDTVLGTALGGEPTPIEGVDGLFGLNIDPEEAARAYRERVVGPYRGVLPDESVASIEEQLSGACTVEIAAFDEFTGLMSSKSDADTYDHVVFDTAPTGHTLRLLQLPAAWTSFIETNERGASCLGPMSGLKNQQERYAEAMEVLADGQRTTLVLVTRPENGALTEAERTRVELQKQGVDNQFLVVNGVFRATDRDDRVALKLEARSQQALDAMSDGLAELPSYEVPLKPYNLVGLQALRDLFKGAGAVEAVEDNDAKPTDEAVDVDTLPRLVEFADELEEAGHGLVMCMGKGGVGKTTVAAALAAELAGRGVPVHLTTTDPAAHIEDALQDEVDNLRVSRIDPEAETEAYRNKVIERSRDDLDAEGLELLKEDLRSPCTEEVAVFHAFSKVVFSAKREIVIMDTAPTGHTLLLLDSTGSYHREMLRQTEDSDVKVATPLMRLQDPEHTKVLVVALAETTPVQEAAHLQEDLRRAEIEPYGWVINRSLAATPTHDPLLRARAREESVQMKEVVDEHARRIFVVPYAGEEPRGAKALRELID